jgi:hypothetical protein
MYKCKNNSTITIKIIKEGSKNMKSGSCSRKNNKNLNRWGPNKSWLLKRWCKIRFQIHKLIKFRWQRFKRKFLKKQNLHKIKLYSNNIKMLFRPLILINLHKKSISLSSQILIIYNRWSLNQIYNLFKCQDKTMILRIQMVLVLIMSRWNRNLNELMVYIIRKCIYVII